MKFRAVVAILISVLLALSACSSPEVVKRKYLETGNRYFSEGKYTEARLMYKNAIKKDARFGEAYYKLGLCELRMGRPADAVRSLRRAVELQPDNNDALRQLADLYMTVYLYSNSKNKQSIRDEISDLVNTFKKRDPSSVDAKRIEGFLAFREGDDEKANKLLMEAYQARPTDLKVGLAAAQTLFREKKTDEAEKLVKELIQKDKKLGLAYDVLAINYMQAHRMNDAEAVIKSKVAAIPESASARLQLASFYFSTQRKPQMEAVLDQVLRDRKTFPKALLIVGDFYARMRQYDNAINYYKEGAAEGGPDASVYRTRQVESLVAQSKLGEATTLLDSILKDDPKNDAATQMRAALRLQSGRPDEVRTALNALTPLLPKQPKNAVLRFNVGRAHMALHELDAAQVQFQEAVNLRSDFISPRIGLAQIYLAKKQFGPALTQAEEILKRDPNNTYARLLKSNGLIGSGMYDQARADLEATLKNNPNSAEALFQMGMLDLAQKRSAQAEATFKKMQQVVPGDIRSTLGLVETAFQRGDADGALHLLQAQVSKFPERTDYRLALANAYMRASRFQQAIDEYRTLLAKSPQAADLYLRLGEALRRSGDLKNAIATFQKGRDLVPNDPGANLALAIAIDTSGNRAGARPLYEQVLAQQPDNAIALNNLAFILAESGQDLDRAMTLAQRARQRMPNDPNVADTLGWVCIKKKLPDVAIPIYEDLVKKLPDHATYLFHLGVAQSLRGDVQGARRSFEAALKKGPSKEEERQIRQQIASMG